MKSGKSNEALAKEYLALLDKCLLEQEYQKFIEEHTNLVPKEFVQNHGIHLNMLFRQLRLASDYVTDFAYLSKSSEDWNLVLVEIERPNKKVFRSNVNKFHSDFEDSLEQINNWRAWFSVPENKANLEKGLLKFVGNHMSGNLVHIKYVLVYGRRDEYSGNFDKMRRISALEKNDFKIMSFDSLLEALHSKHRLCLAAKKNEYIDILSDQCNSTLINDMAYWMKPEHARVSEKFIKEAVIAIKNPDFAPPFDQKAKLNAFLEKVQRRA